MEPEAALGIFSNFFIFHIFFVLLSGARWGGGGKLIVEKGGYGYGSLKNRIKFQSANTLLAIAFLFLCILLLGRFFIYLLTQLVRLRLSLLVVVSTKVVGGGEGGRGHWEFCARRVRAHTQER